MHHHKLESMGKTKRQEQDGAIYIYSVWILQKGVLLVSVVQQVSVKDAPPLHSVVEDKYPQMLLVFGRLCIDLMEASFYSKPF